MGEVSGSDEQLRKLKEPGDGKCGGLEAVGNSVFHGMTTFLEGDESCPLCSLEDDYIYDSEDGWTVVSAEPAEGDGDNGWENGLKGHNVRNVLVAEKHGEVPPPNAEFNCAKFLLEETAKEVENGGLAIYGSMATIDNHFHLVASDLELNEGEPDMGYIDSYFQYEVEEGEIVNFEGGRISDFFGLYMQSMLNEDSKDIEYDLFDYEPNNLEEEVEMSSRVYAEGC
jgi:hypothetical protein